MRMYKHTYILNIFLYKVIYAPEKNSVQKALGKSPKLAAHKYTNSAVMQYLILKSEF